MPADEAFLKHAGVYVKGFHVRGNAHGVRIYTFMDAESFPRGRAPRAFEEPDEARTPAATTSCVWTWLAGATRAAAATMRGATGARRSGPSGSRGAEEHALHVAPTPGKKKALLAWPKPAVAPLLASSIDGEVRCGVRTTMGAE